MFHHPHGRGGDLLPAAGKRIWPDLAAMGHALAQGEGVLELQPVMQTDRPERPAFYEGRLRLVGPGGQQIMAPGLRQLLGNGNDHGMSWANLPWYRGVELGRQINSLSLDLALRLLAEHPDIWLAIALDVTAFSDPGWVEILQNSLAEDDTLADRLMLMVDHHQAAQAGLRSFMDIWQPVGVRFALSARYGDYLNLYPLRDYGFDILRLDMACKGADQMRFSDIQARRGMIRDILATARDCNMLGFVTGVESRAEAALFIDIGADFLQGPHFGLPDILPPDPIMPMNGGLFSA